MSAFDIEKSRERLLEDIRESWAIVVQSQALIAQARELRQENQRLIFSHRVHQQFSIVGISES